MFYVGLDVHLKSCVVCVLDSKGNIVQRATAKNIDWICRGDKDRRNIAVVATAHDLVRVMWAMLKRGEMWSETVKAS